MAARSTSCATAAKRRELKSRCARFFITCPHAENFFALKILKAVTSNIKFICRQSVILKSVFLCYETTVCYFSYRRRRHWAIESETYMVSSYWSGLLREKGRLPKKFHNVDSLGRG